MKNAHQWESSSSRLQLVPAGSSRFQPVPAGSSRFQPVPAGSSRFQPAPDGGCNWFYSINRYFTECLWRSESCHFKKYNFFVKKTYPLTLLSFSQLRYSLEQWKLDIKWGKRRCLQNSKVVFSNILRGVFNNKCEWSNKTKTVRDRRNFIF
jgi:hypothetical protein